MAESQSQNRYLVVARVGDHSYHPEWITPADCRNFDLWLSYYGDTPGRYAQDCEFYTEAKGAKWPKIFDLIKKHGDRIFQYDAVWFPDDDIRTHPGNISRMFELFTEYKLLLAQPALTANSYFQVTAQHIDYKLRYTRFVEVMVPILSRDALQVCYPTFNKSVTGWGMEYVWAKLLGYPEKGMAILDETPVKHTRPPGQGDLYENIKNQLKIDIWDPKYKDVWKEYEIEVPLPEEIGYYDGIKEWNPFTALEEVRDEGDHNKQADANPAPVIKRRKKVLKGKPLRAVSGTKNKTVKRKPAPLVVKTRVRRKASPPVKRRTTGALLTRRRLKKTISR